MHRIVKRKLQQQFLTATGVGICLLVLLLRHDRRHFDDDAAQVVKIIEQNQTESKECDSSTLIFSSRLDTRVPWQEDETCSKYSVRHLIPRCRRPTALASFPGSGNTWVRFLIESAGGVFTGSRYKDLQLQMYGFWGEIRGWNDGTTIVQKTHDASKDHVEIDFEGRGILILRNPYKAILSTHNFLYAGHHGRAPAKNFHRSDWEQFVTVQLSKWLEMASYWTRFSDPDKLLVVHYENLQANLGLELKKILTHLHLPVDRDRIECTIKNKNGFFQRGPTAVEPETVPFPSSMRRSVDKIIESVNTKLVEFGFEEMPFKSYEYFRKEDGEILARIRRRNKERKEESIQGEQVKEKTDVKVDRSHGTKMVLKHYLKWLDEGDKSGGAEGNAVDDVKTALMKHFFQKFRESSDAKTITGLSEQAEGLLEKVVDLWPMIEKPFKKDPIDDVIATDGFRGKSVADLNMEKWN